MVSSLFAGYGDWDSSNPGFPDIKDRRLLLLTNSCRIDPTGYRDYYMQHPHDSIVILKPENYPPQKPLYWHIDLNKVARIHSEDMSQHGLNHSSSDGTSFSDRVSSYYTKSDWIGENIAAGYLNADETMRQWIMDYTDYQTMKPAKDKSGSDGHRANIMSSDYLEMGAGYAYNASAQYKHYWTQDFGGGTPLFDNPISTGAHFIDDSKITFMATCKDPDENSPQKVEVVIENTEYSMSLFLGDTTTGCFKLEQNKGDECRDYYFKFTDSKGKSWRYPEDGVLVTSDEGGCDTQYRYQDVKIEKSPTQKGLTDKFRLSMCQNNRLTISLPKELKTVGFSIYNLKGVKLFSKSREDISNGILKINLSTLSIGNYIILLSNERGELFKEIFTLY